MDVFDKMSDAEYLDNSEDSGCYPERLIALARKGISKPLNKIVTEAMLDAARDWSQDKYGKPIGNDAAAECFLAMARAIDPMTTPSPCNESLEQWIERSFAFQASAVRREDEPPIPGEPFISMATAMDLVRKAVSDFSASPAISKPLMAGDGMVLHPVEEIRELDAIVRKLGIEDSDTDPCKAIDDHIRSFASSILHGDETHKEWLLEAAEAFIGGGSMPPPRDAKTALAASPAPWPQSLDYEDERWLTKITPAPLSEGVVERVAKAICAHHGYKLDGEAGNYGLTFPGMPDAKTPCWEFFKGDAKAAIAAIGKPTEAMIEAGLAEAVNSGGTMYGNFCIITPSVVGATYRAMFTAALANNIFHVDETCVALKEQGEKP